MADLWETLGRIGRELYEGASAASELVPRIGRPSDRVQIVPYRGYGTASEVRVIARVIEEESIAAAARTDSAWRNLVHSVKRMESDEVPGALVRVSVGGATMNAATDVEGYIDARVFVDGSLPADIGWHEVSLDLLAEPRGRGKGVRAAAHVLVPTASARFGVISDIDDTIVRTDVRNLLRMARSVLLTNAHTRLPFPGVAAFYRALRAGGSGADANPIFYVSQSPWNLYDVLSEYLTIQGIPQGPILLRDWGRSDRTTISGGRGTHKRIAIHDILERYPHLPFILIGDSGQEDPEIYREVVERFPQRVVAIYIRNVTPDPLRATAIAALAAEVEKAGSALILADDTMAAARHAAEHGWIQAATLAGIGAERAHDEAEARREGEAEEAPTVEVGTEDAGPR
ncbi:MAG TPA: phosphatase domain-containing protein [Gemmatimonadaceae bacterium]